MFLYDVQILGSFVTFFGTTYEILFRQKKNDMKYTILSGFWVGLLVTETEDLYKKEKRPLCQYIGHIMVLDSGGPSNGMLLINVLSEITFVWCCMLTLHAGIAHPLVYCCLVHLERVCPGGRVFTLITRMDSSWIEEVLKICKNDII